MEADLFENEQIILDNAVLYSGELKKRAAAHEVPMPHEAAALREAAAAYDKLAVEYGRLLKQLRRATRMADRTTIDLHESNLDLTDKVHYDALTGIYNRRYMEDSLGLIMKSLARSGGQLSVLMMDIDCFKKYNDIYGHSAGDACLKTVAQAVSSSIARNDDFAARYGGEEFAAILPNTGEDGAGMLAKRILENVIALDIPHEKNDAALFVTISIGGTTGRVDHTQSAADYIKRADEALYQSKQSGRNRYTFIGFHKEGNK